MTVSNVPGDLQCPRSVRLCKNKVDQVQNQRSAGVAGFLSENGVMWRLRNKKASKGKCLNDEEDQEDLCLIAAKLRAVV